MAEHWTWDSFSRFTEVHAVDPMETVIVDVGRPSDKPCKRKDRD